MNQIEIFVEFLNGSHKYYNKERVQKLMVLNNDLFKGHLFVTNDPTDGIELLREQEDRFLNKKDIDQAIRQYNSLIA